MKDWIPFATAPVALAGAAVPGFANTYLTVEQAQQAIFPGASFTPTKIALTTEQQKKSNPAAESGCALASCRSGR
jgi:hypothetical protein